MLHRLTQYRYLKEPVKRVSGVTGNKIFGKSVNDVFHSYTTKGPPSSFSFYYLCLISSFSLTLMLKNFLKILSWFFLFHFIQIPFFATKKKIPLWLCFFWFTLLCFLISVLPPTLPSSLILNSLTLPSPLLVFLNGFVSSLLSVSFSIYTFWDGSVLDCWNTSEGKKALLHRSLISLSNCIYKLDC